jgi:hypothetical protein
VILSNRIQPTQKLTVKIMDRPVIAERNVVRFDIMVAPLDGIHDSIQTYHWGYLHSCGCVVYTRLVRLFYANLEVVQDDDHGLVLQSTVGSHIITVDPQIISHFIKVPILELPGNPYNDSHSSLYGRSQRVLPCCTPGRGTRHHYQDQLPICFSSHVGEDCSAQSLAYNQV